MSSREYQALKDLRDALRENVITSLHPLTWWELLQEEEEGRPMSRRMSPEQQRLYHALVAADEVLASDKVGTQRGEDHPRALS